MLEGISSEQIEFFKAIEKATESSQDSKLDLKVMDYIGSIVSSIDAEDIRDLSKKGIIEFHCSMTDESGERKSDEITLATNGHHLIIIQRINPADDTERRKVTELQIGIIAYKFGKIADITVLEESEKNIEEEHFYKNVLGTAYEIRELSIKKQKKENAKGIRKIVYKLEDFFIKQPTVVPKSLSEKDIKKLINYFQENAGENAQKNYARKKERREREKNITRKVTTWEERMKAALKTTAKEKEAEEAAALARRAAIQMTSNKNLNPNKGDNR